MLTKINKLPKSTAELTIEVSSEELKPYLAKAAADLSKQMKIPGFRPGHAPYDLVKKQAGEMKIYEAALEPAVAKTYAKAVIEQKLPVIGQPKITVSKLAPGNALVYKAVVSLLPAVQVGKYRGLKISRREVKMDGQEVKKTLLELQKALAKEKRVTRKAQKGDKVEVDLETFRDKVPIDAGQSKNHPITIGEGQFIPGFEDNLIGLAEGEDKSFTLKIPKDYHRKELAGQPVDFKVKVKGIYERELAPLDDNFAKQVGHFEKIEDLRKQLGENIMEEKKVKEKQRWELALLDEILKKSKFEEIPDILVEAELHKMMHELEHEVENNGMKFDDYVASLKKTKDDLQKEFRPRAEKRIKTALVIREIAKIESVEVSESEVEVEHKKQIEHYSANPQVLEYIKQDEYNDYLRNVMVQGKVFEFLEQANK
jgi:trigger factor